MKAAAYIRVSTSKQADFGYSLEAQTVKVRAMAMVKGYELVEIVADDESAKNLNRPGVQKILEMVRAQSVSAVIVMKLDRFTRSVKDLASILEMFNRYDVALISVTESLDTKTASGELSMNIATSVSQWERRAIGERTRSALEYKRSQGQRLEFDTLIWPTLIV
jgi:site-specific DNA recombinase